MTQTTTVDSEGRAPAASEPAQDVRQQMLVARAGVYLCDRVQYQAVQAGQYTLYEGNEKLEDRGTK